MTKKTQRARAAAIKKPRIGDERIRPDGSVIRYVREDDDDKKVADHFRTVDTLALMLRNGSITAAINLPKLSPEVISRFSGSYVYGV